MLKKLSQEAFRLLRTAESLLTTSRPQILHTQFTSRDDLDFLSQLTKEFPLQDNAQTNYMYWHPEPTDFQSDDTPSVTRKVGACKGNDRLSPALSTSLRLTNDEAKLPTSTPTHANPSSLSFTDNGTKSLVETPKSDVTKSSSPVRSLASGEDESGFSSWTSYQEVGLPILPTSDTKNALSREDILKSMLHETNGLEAFTGSTRGRDGDLGQFKTWHKFTDFTHGRSSSVPAQTQHKGIENEIMKVLWV